MRMQQTIYLSYRGSRVPGEGKWGPRGTRITDGASLDPLLATQVVCTYYRWCKMLLTRCGWYVIICGASSGIEKWTAQVKWEMAIWVYEVLRYVPQNSTSLIFQTCMLCFLCKFWTLVFWGVPGLCQCNDFWWSPQVMTQDVRTSVWPPMTLSGNKTPKNLKERSFVWQDACNPPSMTVKPETGPGYTKTLTTSTAEHLSD